MTSLSSPSLTSTLAAEEQKLLACIHCGLCLEACPTYVITGDENDGPRGRLYLMRAVGDGRIPADSDAFERHIDRCLGCRACEQVCPAGVEYGQLLEAARGDLFVSGANRGFSYGILRFMLKHVWLRPSRLKFAFAAARLLRDSGVARMLLRLRIAKLLSKRFEFGLALLESSSPKLEGTRRRRTGSASNGEVARPNSLTIDLMLFTGCVGEGLFSRVNDATARVLDANRFAVKVPSAQVCCGALHAHAGDLAGARLLARRNIAAFDSSEESPIITNAGGCGAMLASYGHLLADDESLAEKALRFSTRVRDVSQQLETVEIKTGADGATNLLTYDASCHLLYGQHAGEAPLKMLGAVTESNFAKLEGSERCCGGAGIYNLLEPELSRSVLEEKLSNIRATGAKILATGNPGCQMQIGAGAILSGMDLTVCHPVELLDESYHRAGMYKNRGQRTENRSQRSEVRNQKSRVSSNGSR
ncbi:MAG: heterodisulfide reductase-related iron-sulfur binding cluster [Acidobacteriota bacterium]|nr:heterodisulfide reductase-related iron-sulfur binding cluster [Acidobacteriota bacterium]